MHTSRTCSCTARALVVVAGGKCSCEAWVAVVSWEGVADRRTSKTKNRFPYESVCCSKTTCALCTTVCEVAGFTSVVVKSLSGQVPNAGLHNEEKKLIPTKSNCKLSSTSNSLLNVLLECVIDPSRSQIQTYSPTASKAAKNRTLYCLSA